jgi:hypothetical protein
MVGKSHEVCYMLEPFNYHYGPGICNAPFQVHFPYITEENEDLYHDHIMQTVNYKYHFWQELKSVKSTWQLRCCLTDFLRFKVAKLKGKRPLFKDPIAFFSAPWLQKRFNFQVVVLIRHPAAFASSIKRLNWSHPFGDFLKQKELINGPLKDYRCQIEDYARKERGIIDQSILLWNIFYSTVLRYKEEHPDWQFLRHEDFSKDAAHSFEFLFKRLNLDFSEAIKRSILEYSSSSNPVESPENQTIIKMDSRQNITNWKKRLSPEEIDQIKSGVAEVSPYFYKEHEW